MTSSSQTERERVLAALVLAFATDPVERWLFPGPKQYLDCFPRFLEAFGGKAFAEGTVWHLGEFSAVAMWYPPGTGPDEDAVTAVFNSRVAPELHQDLFSVVEQMEKSHPVFPHWYLPWLGVDPALSGRGLGGELLTDCLQIVDQDHLPAYLETPNPRTIPFYERHGFEVTGEASSGLCPPVTFMLRAPR